MKILLTAINAKYIHSNPGIYSLKAYAMGRLEQDSACLKREISVELGEYTINNQMGDILKDIYLRKPDIIGFSCYIWNITWVMELVRDLPSVLPEAEIWLGGPEVSYDAADILEREPNVTGAGSYRYYDGGRGGNLSGSAEALRGGQKGLLYDRWCGLPE